MNALEHSFDISEAQCTVQMVMVGLNNLQNLMNKYILSLTDSSKK